MYLNLFIILIIEEIREIYLNLSVLWVMRIGKEINFRI